MSRQDEERVLKKGMEIITTVTGKPVAGYRCPSGAYSEYTLDLLIDNGFVYDASLGGDDIPYLIEGSNGRRLVELPSDHSLDDWPQYVNMREFNMGIPTKSPAQAMEVFRADFDAAWTHGGLWAAIWHPFVSGRLARAEAMVSLFEHMGEKGGVWFATLAEIGALYTRAGRQRGMDSSVERIPFWEEPVPQVVRPSR